MLLQKALSSLLIVVLGLGTAVCPCATMADEREAQTHAHHQSESVPAEHSDCPHAGCLNDCNSLTAAVCAEQAALSTTRTVEFDDFEGIDLETIAYPHYAPMVVSTGPPIRRLWRPADTPVRRYDRLLD